MRQPAFCTIATRSHLKYVVALGRALERHHPGSVLYVLAIDFGIDATLLRPTNVEIIELTDLAVPEIGDMKIYFNAFELCNAIKPFLLFYLLSGGLERLIYLDTDIFVVGKFTDLIEMLDRAPFVLSPHWLFPDLSEQSVASVAAVADFGVYNGGLWGVRRDEDSLRMLQWLMRFLPRFGFDDPTKGMYVDQKLLPLLAQLYHSRFGCIEDPGYNVAYWNLHERTIRHENGQYYANERPVVFFHMSGFRPDEPDVFSHKSPRKLDLPLLKEIISDYMADIPPDPLDTIDYAFSCVGGRRLSPGLRKYYFRNRTFNGYRRDKWKQVVRRVVSMGARVTMRARVTRLISPS
jgi:hypothetical protein